MFKKKNQPAELNEMCVCFWIFLDLHDLTESQLVYVVIMLSIKTPTWIV